jgi:hydrogenase maturation protease
MTEHSFMSNEQYAMSNAKILIMGIGNYLMADEGVGVHLARRMEAMDLPEGADVLDGGTGGFHLLEYFEQYPHVILVDATLDGREPGTIRRIKPRFASDFPQAMSTHDIGLKDLVGALQLLGRMPEIDLFVVSIRSIQEQGIELTPEIEQVMDVLEETVLAAVQEKTVAVV